MMDKKIYEHSLRLHEKNKGKLEIKPKVRLKTKRDLTLAYTPGVAQVCREIAKNNDLAYKYTIKGNAVAIVTDGSAVLGLGNIGGLAAIPVMEGKAILFKEFAGIDGWPICFENYHVDFIEDIKNISPVFGGINLEDIAAPKCFIVEEALQEIGIPVMHDDQHGTAVVVTAALINACKATGKKIEDLKIVISGAGAAGYGINRLLAHLCDTKKICRKIKEILVLDTKGIIYKGRKDLADNKYKQKIAGWTNQNKRQGGLKEALVFADVFIGVSAPNIVTAEMIKTMNKKAVVFALANPDPEVRPEVAKKAGAFIVATGRSDFPNQINNVLAFPGIFRGALDSGARKINDEMKTAAVDALASCVARPTASKIVPNILNKNVTKKIAAAVATAAIESGCARLK